jgi:UDPglucose 6-dehydrogenase
MGRLGLCTALCFEQAGWDVLGSDVIDSYVDSINKKTLRSGEPKVEEMLQASKNLRCTTKIDEIIAHSNVIMILVATPTGTGADQAYDCGVLSRVLSDLNSKRIQDKHVVICCTVMPTYIDRVAKHLLRDCVRCTISYNPEFIAQGDVIRGLLNPDMVLIGEGSKEAGDILEKLHHSMVKNNPIVSRMSCASAEITKLAINCFITTKISYCNMISNIADNTPHAIKEDILKAVGADSRIGPKCLLPGFGFGGPCFPRDNRALGTHARNVGVDPCVSDATDKFNMLHADYIADRMIKTGQDTFVIEDVAYKPRCPVDIIEESHKIEVAKRLVRKGKKVIIKDRPAIVELVRRTYGLMFEYEVEQPKEEPSNGNGSAKKKARMEPTSDMGNPMSSYIR